MQKRQRILLFCHQRAETGRCVPPILLLSGIPPAGSVCPFSSPTTISPGGLLLSELTLAGCRDTPLPVLTAFCWVRIAASSLDESKQGAELLWPGCWWVPSSMLPAQSTAASLSLGALYTACPALGLPAGRNRHSNLLPWKCKRERDPGLAAVGMKQGNVLLCLQFMPFL